MKKDAAMKPQNSTDVGNNSSSSKNKRAKTMTALATAAGTGKAIVTGKATAITVFVGLQNLGNTSYMNAVLQCLFHTKPLKDNFMVLNGVLNMAMVDLLSSLFHLYFSGAVDVIAPIRFVDNFKATNDNFDNFEQQDAVSFLLLLLDALHFEINGSSVSSQWEEFVLVNDSIIIDTFYGCQQSVFECRFCDYSHEVRDPFTCLNLPIPVATNIC